VADENNGADARGSDRNLHRRHSRRCPSARAASGVVPSQPGSRPHWINKFALPTDALADPHAVPRSKRLGPVFVAPAEPAPSLQGPSRRRDGPSDRGPNLTTCSFSKRTGGFWLGLDPEDAADAFGVVEANDLPPACRFDSSAENPQH
jgi:hypothetical protein